jgi:inosose dehydratase
MDRRDFFRHSIAASSAIVGMSLLNSSCINQLKTTNIRWGMGWILWRDFADNKTPLAEAIQTLSDLKLDGIEFSPRKDELAKHGFTRDSFKALLDEKHLAVSGNYFGGNFYDPAQKDSITTAFRATLDNLKFYGARHVIIGPPGRGGVDDINAAIRATAPVLDELGKIALDNGIQLGLHPHVNTIVETPDEIDLILGLTDPLYVRVAPDTGHIRLGGGNVVEIIRKYKDRLSYFHLKDSSGVFDRPNFGPNLRELGKGEIDFPAIMAILKEIEFKGWMNVEQDYTVTTPAQSAAVSASYIHQTLKRIYT